MKKCFKRILKGLLHPNRLLSLGLEKCGRLIPDKPYLKLQFLLRTGSTLNLENPLTFTEKLQWLKIYDRKPEYTRMADKYAAREFISEKIGAEYLIPLLGVWDKFDNIDFDALPDQFVLKTNHDSNCTIICTDKNKFNIKQTRKKIEKHLNQNYYYGGREWVYKDIKPRIIAEKYMVDESGTELKDYKVFCFNGEPKIIQVDFNRFTGHKRNLYSTQWEYQKFTYGYKTYPDIIIKKPESLDKLLELAGILSAGIPQVRVDFYIIHNGIYFGEMTFYTADGYLSFAPREWNNIFGSWITLPKKDGP
jgi:hypothetical protein